MTHSATCAPAGKAVLHCPRCAHSAAWSDWTRGADGHTLRCPACDAPVG